MILVEVEPKRGKRTKYFACKIIVIIFQGASIITSKEIGTNFGGKKHERSTRNEICLKCRWQRMGFFVFDGRSWPFLPNIVLTPGQTCICYKVQRKWSRSTKFSRTSGPVEENSKGKEKRATKNLTCDQAIFFLAIFLRGGGGGGGKYPPPPKKKKPTNRLIAGYQRLERATCFATLLQNRLQNELNSRMFRVLPHEKRPCNVICCKIVSNMDTKTRNIVAPILQNKSHNFCSHFYHFFVLTTFFPD